MTKYTWSGQGTTTAWDDAGNWSPNGVPGADDLAAFTSANATVTGNEVVGAITILAPTDLSFTGTVTTRGLAGTTASFQVGGGARAAFTAGSSLTVADRLTVGLDGGSTSFDFEGNALTTRNTVVGVGAGTQGSISIEAGAYWHNTGSIVLGTTGEGGLSIGGGGPAGLTLVQVGAGGQGGNVVLGQYAGATGVLDVVGGGDLSAAGSIMVGGKFGAGSHGVGQVSVGLNSEISAGGDITVNAGSVISLSGGSVSGGNIEIAAHATITGSGEVSANQIINNGQITASGFLYIDGPISGHGTLHIATHAELGLGSAGTSQAAIQFLGPDATLLLPQFVTPGATLIEGFHPGDMIDAQYVDSISFDSTTDRLSLFSAGQSMGTLSLAGNYAGDTFHLAYSGSLGTITVGH